MNDTPAPKSSKRHYLYLGLAGVSVLVVAGVVVSRSGLDKALLRQQMDAFATALHTNGERQGRDVTLTYGEVGIEGSFSKKHGIVHDVKLTIKPMHPNGVSAPGDESLVVSTPIAEVYPKSVDLSALQVQLPQPLDFTSEREPEKKLLTITTNTPLTLDVVQAQENTVDTLALKHSFPTQIDFTYLREHQAEGAEDATPTIVPVYKKLTMTLAPGGVVQSKFTVDGKGLGQGNVDLRDIQLQPESVPNGAVKINEIVGNWSNSINDKKRRIAALKLHVGDITASPDMLPYTPISLAVDATFDGLDGQPAPQDVAAITAPQSVIKLSQFALSTKDAKLTAQADFVTNSGDILPEGTANITLTNVPYVLKELRDNGIVNAQNEVMVVPILELATGQKIADVTDAVIDVKRVRGGAFSIGKTTFEELFATFLKAAMTKNPAVVPAPAKPADDAKKIPPKKAVMLEDKTRA